MINPENTLRPELDMVMSSKSSSKKDSVRKNEKKMIVNKFEYTLVTF